MNRRSVLTVAGLALSSIVAGCLADGTSTSECHLMHEVVEPSNDYGEVIETYRYEDLSGDAQYVFEETIANGSYATTNQSLEPPEFRYWDTTSVYTITYQNERHTLLTYTGEGCESE